MTTMPEKPPKAVLENLFVSMQKDPEQRKRSALMDCWQEAAGKHVSADTKARFSPGGNVTVWVDDSTLAFELSRRYKPALLKRLRNQFGEEQVKDLRFFVGELH